MKKENKVPKGQEINADFKNEKGTNPNDEQNLEKDLINPSEIGGEATVVKSSDPESQEWNAREDSNK